MKYPLGIQTFSEIISGKYLYVDKTDLVYKLAQSHACFLGRPRCFGKSLLLSTLEDFFLGRKELFKGLAIERFEHEWKQYPVFHLDFNTGNYHNEGTLEEILSVKLSQWEELYGVKQTTEDFGKRFRQVLHAAHEQTGLGAVVLVDEYDKPIMEVMKQGYQVECLGKMITLEEKHRNIMQSFYSSFKAADGDLRFVFLTGVTMSSQNSMFDGFSQLIDISHDVAYEAICGITKDELQKYFAAPIEKLAREYDCNREEMITKLKRKYEGYHFSKRMTDIFNPFSIINVFDQMNLGSYWFNIGTPTYLVRLLSHSDENLDELVGRYYGVAQLCDYKADVENPLSMIYQSGYLTIKGYDRDTESFMLDIPNNEVREGFLTMIANDYLKTRTDSNSWLIKSIHQLKKGKLQEFMEGLTAFLCSIPDSVRHKNSDHEYERHFHYTFYLLLRMLSCFTIYHEKKSSRGRADCIIESQTDVYIFEFKLDGTADMALQQIKDQGYAKEYISDKRAVHLIGANFSSEEGTIDVWKEMKL